MTFVDVYALLTGDVHDSMVEVVESLDDEGLNWRPWAETNSVAVLVAHVTGNQVETIQAVCNRPSNRDRDAEFALTAGRDDLLARIQTAREVVSELGPHVTEDDLERMVTRPSTGDRAILGMHQLFHSVAHAREHLGQMWLVRDLWLRR